jgi:NADP-dependent 3-hydroxy acid dehydrogenase YdfG
MTQALTRAGWTVGMLDIDADTLTRTAAELRAAGAQVETFAGDVAEAAVVAAAVEQFARRNDGLDLIVNNAGVAVAGTVEATPLADWHWIVNINLLGVVWGCRAVLPLFKQADGGLLLNIASSAGFAAAPQMAAYNSTKAAVISVSETLAAELAGTRIQVSVAMPGFFRTHLLDTMRAPATESALAHQLMDTSGHDPEEAAEAILGAAARGDLYIVWPPEYRMAWRLKRWFPRWFLRRIQAFRDAQLRRAAGPSPG